MGSSFCIVGGAVTLAGDGGGDCGHCGEEAGCGESGGEGDPGGETVQERQLSLVSMELGLTVAVWLG